MIDKCVYCNQSFSSKNRWRANNESYNIRCENCNASFNYSSNDVLQCITFYLYMNNYCPMLVIVKPYDNVLLLKYWGLINITRVPYTEITPSNIEQKIKTILTFM